MTLRFDLDMDDLMAFYGHYLKTNKDFRRRLVVWRLLVPVFWLAIVAMDILRDRPLNTVTFIVMLAVSVLWIIFVPALVKRLTLRNARKIYYKPENASFMGPQQMTFTPKGFEAESDGNKGIVRWDKVNKVYRTEDYFFIYMSSMNAYVIPLRQISGEDAKNLGELFKAHNLQ